MWVEIRTLCAWYVHLGHELGGHRELLVCSVCTDVDDPSTVADGNHGARSVSCIRYHLSIRFSEGVSYM
jgi:hypothetical protein